MGDILTIEQIANADDLPTKQIEVPEWGGDIVIRMMTKAQQKIVRVAAMVDGELDDEKLELGILAEAIVEPPITHEHLGILRNKNAEVIDRILHEIFTQSAMDKEALARARKEFPEGSGTVDGVPHSGPEADDGEAPVS